MIDDLLQEDAASLRLVDAISVAVGSGCFVQQRRFDDLYVESPLGRSHRLVVSRFYWDAQPPVAIDFIRQLRMGEAEVAAKKHYFKEHDIQYVLVKDVWDAEGVEVGLAALQPEADSVRAIQNAAKPLIGPRRGKSHSLGEPNE